MAEFDGQVALVTGGNRGIGKAVALAFADRGARVVIAARSEPEGHATVETISSRGGEALFVKADVSEETDVRRMIDRAVETFGRLDYACNNAGMQLTITDLATFTEDEWDRTIDVNLKGAWLCMKYEIKQMLEQGGGTIVNMASTNGLIGTAGFAAYTASKHGMLGLTRAAALDYARSGIRVNALCPGGVHTEMYDNLYPDPESLQKARDFHPMGRLSAPEEIASAAMWLCSSGSGLIMGHGLTIDGGLTTR